MQAWQTSWDSRTSTPFRAGRSISRIFAVQAGAGRAKAEDDLEALVRAAKMVAAKEVATRGVGLTKSRKRDFLQPLPHGCTALRLMTPSARPLSRVRPSREPLSPIADASKGPPSPEGPTFDSRGDRTRLLQLSRPVTRKERRALLELRVECVDLPEQLVHLVPVAAPDALPTEPEEEEEEEEEEEDEAASEAIAAPLSPDAEFEAEEQHLARLHKHVRPLEVWKRRMVAHQLELRELLQGNDRREFLQAQWRMEVQHRSTRLKRMREASGLSKSLDLLRVAPLDPAAVAAARTAQALTPTRPLAPGRPSMMRAFSSPARGIDED
jgi:hypothetical protein